MGMKHWIIIGIFAILMVGMGRNPVEEAREAKQEKLQGKDPLIHAIQEHNRKSGAFTWQSSPSHTTGYSTNTGTGSTGASTYQYPRYMMPPERQYPRPRKTQQQAPTNQQAPTGNSYYPPPPQSSLGGTSLLRGGQQVAFSGHKVYTYDASGKMVPMPDGVYPTYDGKLNLIVRGGRKYVISN